MRKEHWQPALPGAIIDCDPLKNLPDIQTIIPKTESEIDAVAIEPAVSPEVHPMLREAVASLDEMLEAELLAENPSQEEDSVHAAILAAFENKKEVETAVEDVSATCEELKELWDGELVAMPECTDWPDPMPVSRFGEGAFTPENDNNAGSKYGFTMPSKRMLASSGVILLFLTAASVAFFELGVPADQQVATSKTVDDSNSKNAIEETLVASAGEFTLPEPELKPAKVVRQAFQSTRQTGVTQIEKNYTPQQDSDNPVEAVVARVEASERSISPVRAPVSVTMNTSENADVGRQENLSERFFGIEQAAGTSAENETRSGAGEAAPLLQPTRVKTVSLVRNQPQQVPGAPKIPIKRADVVVEQALANAKAVNTLTTGQKAQLLPRLIDGECVATALREVAGRVSPVLMRDLLNSLNSDC